MRSVAALVIAVVVVCGCESSKHDASSASTPASQSTLVAASRPVMSVTHPEQSTTLVTPPAKPPEAVVVGGGDFATFPTLRDLVSNSTLVVRATVVELLPGVMFGHPPETGWALTPTRLQVTDMIYGGAVTDGDPVVLQSGGAFLPTIAKDINAGATVFVDAVLPEPDGPYLPSKDFTALIDRLEVTDGLLPPWNEWWAPEVIARLVPDDALRRRPVDELVRVPRAFYDTAIDLPPEWASRPAGYLQLSHAYEAEATRAEEWSWPTIRLDGQHLDVTVQPEMVAGHVDDLARQLLSPTPSD